MLLYILLVILIVLAITYFTVKLSREKPQEVKKAAKVGGAVAALLFLLRLGPAAIFGLLNLLAMFLPFIKKPQQVGEEKKSESKMSKKEAREILGVSENANEKEIKSAFNKLMKKNHPDKDGSKYLAQKIIQAKKTLIG